ncbi:MAG: thioredoxin [Nitrospirota bacterium]
MAEIIFTDDNFGEEVLKSDVPVLVDFFAEWCGPCKMLGPIVEELTGEYEGKVKIGKLDVDASPTVAGKYGVQSIPTLIFFKGGEAVDKLMGFQSKEALKAKLDAL